MDPLMITATPNICWLQPEVSLAYNRGFSSKVLSALIRVIEERRDQIERDWDAFFS